MEGHLRRRTFEDAAQTAFDAFPSLFCEKNEFATVQAGERFLQGAKDDRNDIIDQLMAWCERLLPEHANQEEHLESDEESDEEEDEEAEDDEDEDEDDEQDGEDDQIMLDSEKPPRTKVFEAATQQEIRDLVESYAFSSSIFKTASLWPLFKIVRIGLRGIFRRLQEKLMEECRDIVAQMDNTSAQYRLDRGRFTDFIEIQLRGIHHLCQDSKAELKKQLDIAKIEATQDDEENPTGYFSLAMQGTWDQCKEYKCTASEMKVLTALETQLQLGGDRSSFALGANSLAKAISDNVEEQTRAVIEGVERVMDDIKDWLDFIFKEEANAPEDLEVRDRLKAYLEKGVPRFNEIRACLTLIERRYETDPQVAVKQE
ncbi:hypothetical protein AC579_9817 [Pseudocercospora musae]|uniref:Uncharacterized protein n=1 Tax=Pseudocercospora musae TaxID=113226 RepID=A0A139IV05_9PEZI|nr:hypothetical protein AC579_9817 [Pseudocercospora musae]